MTLLSLLRNNESLFHEIAKGNGLHSGRLHFDEVGKFFRYCRNVHSILLCADHFRVSGECNLLPSDRADLFYRDDFLLRDDYWGSEVNSTDQTHGLSRLLEHSDYRNAVG